MENFVKQFRDERQFQGLVDGLYSTCRLYLAIAEEDPANIQKAMTALQEAEDVKKSVKPDQILIEHQLFLHARAHRLAGLGERADDYLKQAYDWLMACADKIENPEYRQSYLKNVPENVAIQQAYQDRFGGKSNMGN